MHYFKIQFHKAKAVSSTVSLIMYHNRYPGGLQEINYYDYRYLMLPTGLFLSPSNTLQNQPSLVNS